MTSKHISEFNPSQVLQIINWANGSRLCAGGGFLAPKPIEVQMLNLLQKFNSSSSAPLAQNRCYMPFFFGMFITNLIIKQFKISQNDNKRATNN